jgi:hypothetical protein
MITESVIDRIVKQAEDGKIDLPLFYQNLSTSHPVLFKFLFSRDTTYLSAEEHELLLFLAMVIIRSCEDSEKEFGDISGDKLDSREEVNWQVFESARDQDFSTQMDQFFKRSPEEDLLAFIEDALIDDDESLLSPAGRELICIKLISIVDCLAN